MFEYKLISENEIEQVINLIKNVFDEFVAPLYTYEGVSEFSKYLDQASFKTRLQSNHFLMGCYYKGDIIGVIEIRNYDHVSLLFVDGKFQRKGIAKYLFYKAINICINKNKKLVKLTVNASPNSVEIYKKLGFIEISDKKESNGIIFVPMKYIV